MTGKSIIFAGNYAVATSGANTFIPSLDANFEDRLGENKTGTTSMDVLFNIKTLTGTSPTVKASVQETFSDVGYVETANSGSTAYSTSGKYFLAHDGQTGQTATGNILYGFAMMGKGIQKQIVFTNGGTIGAVSIDVYFIFYGGN